MFYSVPVLNSLIRVRIGEETFDGAALLVGGQSAAIALPVVPRIEEPARLTLAWDDGQYTELDARVRRVDDESRVAHFDVEGVNTGWQRFVEYLGSSV